MEFMTSLGSLGSDPLKPSIFEYVSQKKLNVLFNPALKYILTIYAQRYPRTLLKLLNYYEEFYLGLNFIIQKHYLELWNATFSESFYGLRRLRITSTNSAEVSGKTKAPDLTNREKWLSLLVEVGGPYIKCKLDQAYEAASGGLASQLFGDAFDSDDEEEDEYEDYSSNENLSRKEYYQKLLGRLMKVLKKVFVKVYPYLHMVINLTELGYQIGYLYNHSKYPSPFYHVLNLMVRRMTMDDMKYQYEKSQLKSNIPTHRQLSRPQLIIHIMAQLLGKLVDILKVALPMSIFFFKFVEWWYSSPHSQQSNLLPALNEPPAPLPPHPKGLQLPKDASLCPLCLRQRTNPTIIPSGYVFCYPCIYSYLEEFSRCPVTWSQTKQKQLRRIYFSTQF